MAKNFYSAEEAAQKLSTDESGLKKLVQEGKLREFRDAGNINYKVTDVDAIAPDDDFDLGDSASDSAMESGEIVLEAVEDSSIEFSPSGSDILSLDELDSEDTTAGTRTGASASSAGTSGGSSAIPSVGINVFDDDEDDEVDPLARTAVTDMAGLGLEGTGSGSGILDLTRESDDTSLGSELLEEIYTDGEDEEDEEAADGTRAGFDQGVADTDAPAEVNEEAFAMDERSETAQRVVMVETVAYAPDATSSGLTALLLVAIIVMWFAGLGSFAAVRGVTPSLLMWIYKNLAMCAGGAVLVGVLATVITFFLAKRGS